MQNTIIVIDKEPYCIWGIDLKKRNFEFINSIDGEYLDYIVKTNITELESEDDKRASIALRSAYHHGIETLFSILGSLIQAHDCVYAWILKCSSKDLRKLILRIDKRDESIFTKLNITNVTWDSIAEYVFRWYLPETEKNKKTSNLFAILWSRLADDYLNANHIIEYNSIKHGFRIKSGGFLLKSGIEHEYGIPPPEEEMSTVGYSKYGSTFYILEKVGGNSKRNRSYRSKSISLNWPIEKVVLLLQLISISIQNITSALKIVNGIEPNTVRFFRPSDDIDFDKPWSFSTGVINFSFDYGYNESLVQATTKEELENSINKFFKGIRKRTNNKKS